MWKLQVAVPCAGPHLQAQTQKQSPFCMSQCLKALMAFFQALCEMLYQHQCESLCQHRDHCHHTLQESVSNVCSAMGPACITSTQDPVLTSWPSFTTSLYISQNSWKQKCQCTLQKTVRQADLLVA